MGSFEIELVLPIAQFGPERTPRWTDARDGRLSEETGFDTIWIADALLWQVEDASPQGAWVGVSIMGGVAAVTSRIMSACGCCCPPSQPGHHCQDCGKP